MGDPLDFFHCNYISLPYIVNVAPMLRDFFQTKYFSVLQHLDVAIHYHHQARHRARLQKFSPSEGQGGNKDEKDER